MWASDEVRRGCSSGGAAFELARGRRFCGVRYNASAQRAEHFVGSAEDARGSKYLQSYSPEGFREALRDGGMIVGTPCQIASLRRHIGEDDRFLLVDFFCHGVPSKWLWDKYLTEHPELVEGVRWRDKTHGWRDSYRVSGGGYISPRDDMFFTFFLRNYVSMRECYDCPWRLENSAADVRVGDLWGERDELGVSAVVAMTARGERAVLAMQGVTLREQDVMQGRPGGNVRIPRLWGRLLRELKGRRTLRGIYKKYELWLRIGRKL